MTGSPPRLLTAADVAELLQCSPRHVQQLARTRTIPAVRVGKPLRFHPDDITRYITQNRKDTP